jgi:hypothetical protein
MKVQVLGSSQNSTENQYVTSRLISGTVAMDALLPWLLRQPQPSYPNADDKARARRLGVSPGSDIFLHGLPNGYEPSPHQTFEDWTDGCIAVTDPEIDEIFRPVPDGTPIEIKP